MAKIEGIRVANYRVLRDVTLGKLWNAKKVEPLTPLTTVVGKNGVGKSSLFDAFGFLADCLKHGVEEACDARGRGGFHRIRSQGTKGPMEFEVYYRQHARTRPMTYQLSIDVDRHRRPYVARERLRQRRKGQKHGRPASFLVMQGGTGLAWKGNAPGTPLPGFDLDEILGESANSGANEAEESATREIVSLEDKRRLGIATLGALTDHPRISSFRKFVEGWHLSCFAPDAARSLPLAGPQGRLSVHGDNLGNVVQFMESRHPRRFKDILRRIAGRVPGIEHIDTHRSSDGRLLLRFNDSGFKEPFYAQQVSDGTLKLFAYLLMLEDPSPPPLICIEEPESGLHHKLLEILARELRDHAAREKKASQVFVTTHHPYFVDALSPKETWILEKTPEGFATIRRASDDLVVQAMVNEGLPLGGLWYNDYLD